MKAVHRGISQLGIAALVSLAALLILVGVYLSFFVAEERAQSLHVPDDLVGFAVLEGSPNSGVLHMFTERGMREILSQYRGSVVDFATNGLISAAIVRFPVRDSAVVTWKEDQEPEVIVNGDRTRSALSISPDGRLVAYAEMRSDAGATPEFSISDWEVLVVGRETGEEMPIGSGFAPKFVPDEAGRDGYALFYDAPDGLTVVSLHTGERTTLHELSASLSGVASHVSPDGRHLVAYNHLIEEYVLFEIYRFFPLGLSAVGVLPNGFSSIAVTNTHLYGIEAGDAFSVESVPFTNIDSGKTHLFSFPHTVSPARLIPPTHR